MLTKYNAKKVYKYLKKRMFCLEYINPRIRELLLDDKILIELNKKLLPEQQLYKTNNLYITKISLIKDNDREYIGHGVTTAHVTSQFFKYGILEKVELSDEELDELKYKKFHIVNCYNWITKKHKIIQYDNHYVDYLKGDFFLRDNIIPFSFYKDYDFITLEQINEYEKAFNNEITKNQNLKKLGF